MVQKLPLHGQPRSCRFGGDHLLDQGQQLGQPGAGQDTADPAGGSDGDWLPAGHNTEQRRGAGGGQGWREGSWVGAARQAGCEGPGSGEQQPRRVGTGGSRSLQVLA